MENITLKEDLKTVGEPATQDQILTAKQGFVKKVLNTENLDTENLTDEECDNIIGKMLIDEKVNKVINYALSEKLDVIEQLHEIVGFKESEASNVYFDYLNEMRMHEAENAENLTVKEKDEILNYREPESAEASMGKNIFKVDKVDHMKDLENQKGEKFKGVKDGDL